MADKYLCRGEDRQDLTALVEAMREAQSSATARMAAAAVTRMTFQTSAATHTIEVSDKAWKVMVTCDSGHQNIFEG